MPERMGGVFGPPDKTEEDFPGRRIGGSSMKREVLLAVAISLSVHLAAALALVTVPTAPFLASKGAGYFEIAFFLSDHAPHGGAAVSPQGKSPNPGDAKPRQTDKTLKPTGEQEIPAAQEAVTVTIASSSASLHADGATAGPAKGSSAEGDAGAVGAPAREGSSGPGGTTIAMPRYFDNKRPVYPLAARRNGYEGTIILTVQVLSSGTVGELRVKKSSGYEILDQSAREAVRKWRFEPGRRMGQPVTTWVEIPIRFVLTAQGQF